MVEIDTEDGNGDAAVWNSWDLPADQLSAWRTNPTGATPGRSES